MTSLFESKAEKPVLWSYLLFWYLTSITQLLLAVMGYVSFEGFKDTTITAGLWLIPLLLFPRYAKPISGMLATLIWLFALPGVGYFLIYRQELTHSLMFIIFESNKSESAEYFQNYVSWSVLAGFIIFTAIPIFIWTKIKPLTISRRYAYAASLTLFLIIFLSPMYKALVKQDLHAAQKSIDRHLSVAPPWQLVLGYRDYRKELAEVERNLLNFKKIPPLQHLTETQKKLPTTVVIVIGESTTRVHMGLYGYPRDTNPQLGSIKDELTVFSNVFSSRPNTIESLEQVLTFADQEHPDWYKTKPSVIAMLKQAGYQSYWISNQQTLTARNTMLTTFAKQANVQIFLNNARSQNAYSFDEKVLEPYLRQLNQPDEKKLIVVHLLGTHMKYSHRYPESFAHFKDASHLIQGLSPEKIQTINEYDNAIRYNDHIVYKLIDRLKKTNQNSLLVYFSDHGEDVYDSKSHDFKGRNEGRPTYPMYAVPFIVWHSSHWPLADKLKDPDILNRQYDNADFIYTISDLLGLRYDGYLDDESLVSKSFIEDSIVVGDPYGKAMHLLEGTQDFEMKQKSGMHY
ncbi:MAG: hypothetical protein CTY33_00430 [Methylotenera sp.]|nr:MAG: hypothetical protein CTY33_00430 [Methylotenera sp.]